MGVLTATIITGAIVAIAGDGSSGRLATAHSDGRIWVRSAGATLADLVHTCPAWLLDRDARDAAGARAETDSISASQPLAATPEPHGPSEVCPQPTIRLAWTTAGLVIACPGAGLFQWSPGQRAARPLPDILPVGAWPRDLAGGDRLLIATAPPGSSAADPASLYRASLVDNRLERLAELPPGTGAIASARGGPLAAASGILWRLHRRRWLPIAELEICALLSVDDDVYAAGPDGLWRVSSRQLELVDSAPAARIAAVGQSLLVLDGAGLVRELATDAISQPQLPTSPVAPPRRARVDYRRRAARAALLPRLEMAASTTRHQTRVDGLPARRGGSNALRIWVWLTWDLDELWTGAP